MSTKTYSFLDLSGAIATPTGAYTFTGMGVGEVDISMTETRTVHDVAADGSVMVTKQAGNQGTISITCQQVSDLHKWLLAQYNMLITGPPNLWAQMAILMRNVTDGTSHSATGVSFQKVPDKKYGKQGGSVTWILMAADVQSLPV